MDAETTARCHDGLRTALALALAQLRGDAQALVDTWNASDDTGAVVQSLAVLPTLVVESMLANLGLQVDLEGMYADMLRSLAASEN